MVEAGSHDYGSPNESPRSYYLSPETSRGYPETVLNAPGFEILTGTSNIPLARAIGNILGREIQEGIATRFADNEIRVQLKSNMRRRDTFIIQPTCPPEVNDYLMELIFMIDAAKRSSSGEITAIIPYFGYSRQDRKDQPRVPISAAKVARMIQNAGADRIVTLDLHSEQVQGSVDIPWDNLYASNELIPAIKKRPWENLVVASPDKGGVSRATAYAKRLDTPRIAIVFKVRDLDVTNKSEAVDMIGEVEGSDVLIVDDMIDTAGTTLSAAKLILSRGARSVSVAATHGLFSGPALERISDPSISEVFVTDSAQLKPEVTQNPKIHVVSVADLLSEAIKRIYVGESLSALFLENGSSSPQKTPARGNFIRTQIQRLFSFNRRSRVG